MNLPRRIAALLQSSPASKNRILPRITVLQSPYATTTTKSRRNPEPAHSDPFTPSNSSPSVPSPSKEKKNSHKKGDDSNHLGFSGVEVQKIHQDQVENPEHLSFSDQRSYATETQKLPRRNDGFFERLEFTGEDVHKNFQKEDRDSERLGFTNEVVHKSFDKEVREWPRPSVIPFQAKIANSVHLIGHVSVPIQSGEMPDGTAWAATLLVQDKSLGFPQFMVPVIFEGDLAEVAACHLREKDAVYITGQLCADSSRFTIEDCETNLQVMVNDISFVDKIYTKKEELSLHKKKEHSSAYSGDLWNDLLTNPHKWCDCRKDKATARHPDFKHMESGRGLWVDLYVPAQVLSALKSPEFCARLSPPISTTDTLKNGTSAEKTESQWTDLLTNPQKWLDYRSHKLNGLVNPRHPDFRHENTSEPLWLNTVPNWVSPKLEGLKFKVDIIKRNKENVADLWLDLVKNPDKWWDYRLTKTNPKQPDFKHKENDKALWLDSCPEWALLNLKSIQWERKI